MQKADSFELSVESEGVRLDRYVTDQIPHLSRAAVQRLVADGNVLVDGIARKPSYLLRAGQVITVRIPAPAAARTQPEQISLDIVYEDENMLVIDKPAGMVVHPAAGHSSGTLVNAVLAHVPNLLVGGEERPGVVHRLDADTSGLILIAKNDRAMRHLQAQFKSRAVKKTYVALVEGRISPPSGRIEAPIGRDPRHRQKMAIVTSGSRTRDAVTVYYTLANLDGYSLVRVEPETGRTHQIRVHLTYAGFPVVADSVYGSKRKNRLGLSRHFLHAWKISFVLLDGKAISLTTPLPEDLRVALEQLNAKLDRLPPELFD